MIVESEGLKMLYLYIQRWFPMEEEEEVHTFNLLRTKHTVFCLKA